MVVIFIPLNICMDGISLSQFSHIEALSDKYDNKAKDEV